MFSKIQGRSQLITDLICAIDAFQNKLSLFQKQLSSGNTMLFQSMSSSVSNCNSNFISDFKKYVYYCQDLGESFPKKFQYLNGKELELFFFPQPFRVNVEGITHAETQLEMLDLQANTDMKAAFINHGLNEFYRRLDSLL